MTGKLLSIAVNRQTRYILSYKVQHRSKSI